MVNDTEDAVMQAFLGDKSRPAAFRLLEPDLIRRSGLKEPLKVLRALRKKYGGLFEPVMDAPYEKGVGWGVRIVRAAQ